MEDRNREVEMKSFLGVCIIFVVFFAGSSGIFSQSSGAAPVKDERTVEESYLQETLEALVIREQAQSDSREMKKEAIKTIEEAIKNGRKGEGIFYSLDYLALDGLTRISRTGGLGKPTNNFPDVRSDACRLLGEIGTEAAKDSLVKVVFADNEPMVISSAIRSLGKMGSLATEETTQAISYIVNRYDVLAPDNTLAFEALVAYEKIADAHGGLKDPVILRSILKLADGNYVRDVQEKAKDLLKKYTGYNAASVNSLKNSTTTKK
jgi:HEAT repeat protein